MSCLALPASAGALMAGPGGPRSCAGTVTAGSLLFSLDVEEEARSSNNDAMARLEQRLAQVAGLCRFAQQHGEELQLVFDVQRVTAALRSEASDGTLDVTAMAARLGAMGYCVTVRNALGGGPACFRNLRHEFLTVLSGSSSGSSPPAAAPPTAAAAAAAAVAAGGVLRSSHALAGGLAGPAEYIVDPFFKQQFEVSQPSSAYAAVLALVPAEFVGPLHRLVPLVHALCAEMAASFEAMGLTLPPWRRAGAMLSKWQPSRCRDVCITSAGGGGMPDCSSGDLGSDGGGSTGSSPTALDAAAAAAAAGGSPFSRVAVDHQISRQCSGRSLLSGKLLSHTGAAISGSSNSSSMRSSSSLGRTATSSSTSSARSGAICSAAAEPVGATIVQALQQPAQQAAPDAAQHQQQAVRAAQAAGTVSRQPPVYRGLPATYTVKMGGALAPPAAAAAAGHQPGGQPLLH